MTHEELEKAFIEHVKYHHDGVIYAVEEEKDGRYISSPVTLRVGGCGVTSGTVEPKQETVEDKIAKAEAMVSALCQPHGTAGKREWIMSIPARPDYDPDLVIADALHSAAEQIAALKAQVSEAHAQTDTKHSEYLSLFTRYEQLVSERDAARQDAEAARRELVELQGKYESDVGIGAGLQISAATARADQLAKEVKDMNQSKWFWMMDYCKIHGIAAAQSEAWRMAEGEADKHVARADALAAQLRNAGDLLQECVDSHLDYDGDNRSWRNIEQNFKTRIIALLKEIPK